jgi:hypothetical protein
VHLFDCVMPCAGAEAFVVTTPESLPRGWPAARIMATIERHNAYPTIWCSGVRLDDGRSTSGRWPGSGPGISTAFRLRRYPVIVAMQLRTSVSARRARLRASCARRLRHRRHLPLNTNGGQLSAGQAGAAGGYQN